MAGCSRSPHDTIVLFVSMRPLGRVCGPGPAASTALMHRKAGSVSARRASAGARSTTGRMAPSHDSIQGFALQARRGDLLADGRRVDRATSRRLVSWLPILLRGPVVPVRSELRSGCPLAGVEDGIEDAGVEGGEGRHAPQEGDDERGHSFSIASGDFAAPNCPVGEVRVEIEHGSRL